MRSLLDFALLGCASLLLLVFPHALADNTLQPGGRCDQNTVLPAGFCCDWYGFAGTGDRYCGSLCLYNCPISRNHTLPTGAKRSTDGKCNENVYCPPGECCSRWGFCGTSTMHCDVGCLNQCRTPLPIDPGHYVGGGKRPAPDDDLDYCEDDADDVPYDELPYCEDLPPFQFPIMQLAPSTQVYF